MKITIYDYNDKPTTVEVDDDIKTGVLLTISGDQVLQVRTKDGTTKEYDSSQTRNTDFLDDSQIIDLYDGLDCKALNNHCGLF